MLMQQLIEEVPYTARYKLTYTDWTTREVTDRGMLKSVSHHKGVTEAERAVRIPGCRWVAHGIGRKRNF